MVPGITFISHRKDFRSEISVEAQIEGCSPVPGTVRDQRPCGRVDSVVGGAWEPTGSSHQGHQVQSQSWGSTHNIQLHAIAPLQHCSEGIPKCIIATLIRAVQRGFQSALLHLKTWCCFSKMQMLIFMCSISGKRRISTLGAIAHQNTPDQARRGIRR